MQDDSGHNWDYTCRPENKRKCISKRCLWFSGTTWHSTKYSGIAAAVKIQELQSDQIINQQGVMQLQEELIRSKGDQVEEVQSTVKTEIKLFWEAVN